MADSASPGQGIYASPLGSARNQNRVMEAVSFYQEQQRLGRGGGHMPAAIPTDIVKFRNDSCGDRRAGEILRVCEFLLAEVTRPHLWLSAAAPDGQGCIGVLLRPLPIEGIDEAQVAGAVAALINVSSLSHTRATVSPGSVVLVSTSNADAP